MMKYIIPLFTILAVSALILISFLKFSRVVVTKVDIKNAKCLSEDQVRKVIPPTNLLLLDQINLESKIKDSYPCTREVEWVKKWPNQLEVNVSGREAFLKVLPYQSKFLDSLEQLEASPSSRSALLDWNSPEVSGKKKEMIADNEGVIFETGNPESLPAVFLKETEVTFGKKISFFPYQSIVAVVEKLAEMKLKNTTGSIMMKVDGNSLQVYTEPKISFSLEKDIKKQLASLQLILQKATINQEEMNTIDLRFDKPVVTNLPTK